MARLRRILCATDFSAPARPAWEFAQRLALATEARLVLLHVVPWIPVPIEGAIDPRTYQRLMDDGRQAALADLDQLAHAGVDPALPVTLRVEDGPAAQRILTVTEQEDADLVVVGTHGRTGLTRLLLGSVAEQVVQLSRRPVVTVRPQPGAAGASRGLRRLLYPTDFSPPARRAWPWVRALAQATGAEVDVLHVLLEVVPDRHVDPDYLAQAARAIRDDAQRSMDEFLAGCGLPPDRVTVHLAHGVESDQVAHWAGARGADLIVIGTHGRTGVLRLALGSVARRVLHAAPCPVLTVGPEVGAESPPR